MRISLSKKKLFFFIILINLMISCSIKADKSLYRDLLRNSEKIETINIKNLMNDLLEADNKLIPKKIKNLDGTYFYRYKRRLGDKELSVEEIEKRILLGGNYFKKNRENVRILLRKINQLRIKNKLGSINSGAIGLWIPKKDLILIDNRAVQMGSQIFLETLRHEAIHVAQSCFTNSRKNFPVRIGLPLDYSSDINLNLTHEIYSKNSKEVMNIEREAFTYSKINGVAIKLLDKFCK